MDDCEQLGLALRILEKNEWYLSDLYLLLFVAYQFLWIPAAFGENWRFLVSHVGNFLTLVFCGRELCFGRICIACNSKYTLCSQFSYVAVVGMYFKLMSILWRPLIWLLKSTLQCSSNILLDLVLCCRQYFSLFSSLQYIHLLCGRTFAYVQIVGLYSVVEVSRRLSVFYPQTYSAATSKIADAAVFTKNSVMSFMSFLDCVMVTFNFIGVDTVTIPYGPAN